MDLSDDDPATREHLLPVNVVDYFSGECLNRQWVNGQLANTWLTEAFETNDLTIEKCLDLCKLKKYAGLGSGHNCYCGDEIFNSDILSDSWVELWIAFPSDIRVLETFPSSHEISLGRFSSNPHTCISNQL